MNPRIEDIIDGINDLRDTYISRYGQLYNWSEELMDIFLTNSDTNLKYIFEHCDIYPDKKVIKYGITKGIIELITLQESICDDKYGCELYSLDYNTKSQYYEELYDQIYIFLTLGVSCVY